MEDKHYFNKVCLCRFILVPSLAMKVVFLLLVQERGVGTSSQWKICTLPLGRKGRVESFPLYLLFVNYLQLKLILMLKWHIFLVAHSFPLKFYFIEV